MSQFLLATVFGLAWAWVLCIAGRLLERCLPGLGTATNFHLALVAGATLPLLFFMPVFRGIGLPLRELAQFTPLPDIAKDVAVSLGNEIAGEAASANGDPAWRETGLSLAVAVYAAGALHRLAALLRMWRHLARVVSRAQPIDGNRQTRWPVLVTDEAIAPFAFGIRRAIVLPRDLTARATKEQIHMVIAHEDAHLKARDPEIATFLALVAALFWFNPFLHRLIENWRQASELRADRAVLAGAPNAMRSAYARALLSALHIAAGRALPCPPASFSTLGLRNAKMRIAYILEGGAQTGKGRNMRAVALLAGALATGIGGILAVSASTAADTGPGKIVEGRLAVSFGIIRADGTFHKGVDIAAPAGTPIRAPEDMVVIEASDAFQGEPRYGKGVELRAADGTRALFAHLDSYSVKPGDTLRKGDAFATVGKTGSKAKHAHLHLEAFRDHRRVDPLSLWPELGR